MLAPYKKIMFIFQGKLNWLKYAKNELFIIILPHGNVRAGDVVYLFWQYGFNTNNVTNANYFQKLSVERVLKADDGEDVFTLAGSYYNFQVTTHKLYSSLTVDMSKADGSKSIMDLAQVYKTDGEESLEPMRIWTGKLTWPNYATNEIFFAIAPEGLGADKPVQMIWQWTKNAYNQPKFPCILNGRQAQGEKSDGLFKFTFTDYYTMDCTWDEKSEKLSISMAEPHKHKQDLNPMTLAALYKRETQ